MNNNQMTIDEMSEIAKSILIEDYENMMEADTEVETKEFMELYSKTLDLLSTLKGSIIQVQKGKKSSGEPGSGSFTKAYNASLKLENEIKAVNKATIDFIKSMKDFIADTREV